MLEPGIEPGTLWLVRNSDHQATRLVTLAGLLLNISTLQVWLSLEVTVSQQLKKGSAFLLGIKYPNYILGPHFG